MHITALGRRSSALREKICQKRRTQRLPLIRTLSGQLLANGKRDRCPLLAGSGGLAVVVQDRS